MILHGFSVRHTAWKPFREHSVSCILENPVNPLYNEAMHIEYSTGPIPPAPIQKVTRNLLFTTGILFLVFTVLFAPILWTLSMVFFVWGWWYARRLRHEFEYILDGQQLYILKIFNRYRRRVFGRYDLNSLQRLTDDPGFVEEYYLKPGITRTRKAGHPGRKAMALVFPTEAGHDILCLDMDPDLRQALLKQKPFSAKVRWKPADHGIEKSPAVNAGMLPEAD